MKTVLLTGCTSGIGKALSKEFASDNHNLILVARNKDKVLELSKELSKKYGICTYPILCDLREQDAYQQIYRQVEELNLVVDILVNAAGFGIYGEFVDSDPVLQQELLQVNMSSLLCLCNLFGLQMKKRGRGYIINFSSISGFFPGTYMSSYYASKAFILSYSISLARELKPFGVKVLALCPGVIDTPFYNKAKADKRHSYLLYRMSPISASKFAEKAYKTIKKEKIYYKIIGIKNKILVFLSIFVPKRVLAAILSWIQAKK